MTSTPPTQPASPRPPAQADSMLRGDGVSYSYGAIAALRDVTVSVARGQAMCVIGPNGAGKTTLARVLGGIMRPSTGRVSVGSQPMAREPHKVVSQGVASVLEGRHLFVEQDVRTNLELGGYAAALGARKLATRLERVYDLFPALRDRSAQVTGSLSGGEQQMVAVGRALVSEPSVLILDEPSMGLSPKVASDVFGALAHLRDEGLSIVLVEQNATLAFELTSYVYLLQQGQVVHQGTVEQMRKTEIVQQVYLGGA